MIINWIKDKEAPFSVKPLYELNIGDFFEIPSDMDKRTGPIGNGDYCRYYIKIETPAKGIRKFNHSDAVYSVNLRTGEIEVFPSNLTVSVRYAVVFVTI